MLHNVVTNTTQECAANGTQSSVADDHEINITTFYDFTDGFPYTSNGA